MSQVLLSFWGMLQARVVRLEGAVLLLALATCGLSGLLAWLATRPAPIYYIPPTVGPGLLRPGDVPEALVMAFAEHLVLVLSNITPVTVEAAQHTVEPYLHPTLLTPFRARAAQERSTVVSDVLSAQLSIRQTTVTQAGVQRQVTVAALRRVYVGALPIRDDEVQATLHVQPVPPSPLNPYGLVVTALEMTPPLTPSKEAAHVARTARATRPR